MAARGEEANNPSLEQIMEPFDEAMSRWLAGDHTLRNKAGETLSVCVSNFIATGIDVNEPIKPDCTALYIAARFSDLKCMRKLIEAGADVNCQNSKGRTPLLSACVRGSFDCIRLLLRYGAAVNHQDSTQNTSLMEAIKGRNMCISTLTSQLKADYFIKPTLISVIDQCYLECVDMLLKEGSDVNKRGSQGRSALHCLIEQAEFNYIDNTLVESLIKHGADVNLVDDFGSTALMIAVKFEQLECMKTLVVAGADVNVVSSHGTNAWELALSPYLRYQSKPSSTHITKIMKSQIDECHRSLGSYFLRHGLKINTSTKRKRFKFYDVTHKRTIGLLYAAGEEEGRTYHTLPDYLPHPSEMNLMNICRVMIRNHLLKLDLHTHLFDRVPRLGLPSLMSNYLLYEQTLDEDIVMYEKLFF